MGAVRARRRQLTRRGATAAAHTPGALKGARKGGSAVQITGKGGEEIRALREALAPTPGRPLSQEQLARLLGVSWSTVARWETGREPGAELAQKLRRLRRAVELLGDMVTPEHRVAFFEQRHPGLLKLRPIDLLGTPEGAEAVYRALEAAETGAFG
jgi:DNA-binding transcriptional regulator YiaG